MVVFGCFMKQQDSQEIELNSMNSCAQRIFLCTSEVCASRQMPGFLVVAEILYTDREDIHIVVAVVGVVVGVVGGGGGVV